MEKILFLMLLINVWACINPPDYSDSPEIQFVSMSKDTMLQGSLNEDSLRLVIFFTDGDGDIGRDSSIFLRDLRDSFLLRPIQVPMIPEENTGNGIEGTISMIIPTSCCVDNDRNSCCAECDPTFTEDKLIYEVYLEDRAGNRSNTIQTLPITLLCK